MFTTYGVPSGALSPMHVCSSSPLGQSRTPSQTMSGATHLSTPCVFFPHLKIDLQVIHIFILLILISIT